MVQFQDSISKRLHHHTLSNMLSNETSEAHCARIFSCYGPRANAWLITKSILPTFQLSSMVFCTTFHTQLGLPHPSIAGIFQCVCIHPIDPMGIHFLRCTHGNECTGTNDAIHDTFAAIMWDVGFHMGWKQLHALPSITFNSSHWRINIVFTKYGIRTLANIVIVDPTWTDFLPRSCITQGFVALDVTQAKEKSYCNRHPIDQFLPLVIEIFACLHKHADVFLRYYANAIWSLKRTEGLHLSTLVTFLCEKNSITL
jgi:hypothetical protein